MSSCTVAREYEQTHKSTLSMIIVAKAARPDPPVLPGIDAGCEVCCLPGSLPLLAG